MVNVSGFHVDPGYRGQLTFAVFNAGPVPIHLKRGQPIFLIWYASLDRETAVKKDGTVHLGIDPELITGIAGELQSFAGLSKKVKDVDKSFGDRIHALEKRADLLSRHRRHRAGARDCPDRELVEGPLPFQPPAGATQCGFAAVGAPMKHLLLPNFAFAATGVYELNKIDLLKDVFIWAYERSAGRYAAVRQSLGEPDPFRLRYREQLRELIAALVRARVRRKDVAAQDSGLVEERNRPLTTASVSPRSSKPNSPACMKAISPAIESVPRNSQPGGKSGRRDDRHRAAGQTAGPSDLRPHHRALSRHQLQWKPSPM